MRIYAYTMAFLILFGGGFFLGMGFCARYCKPYIPLPIPYYYDASNSIYGTPIGRHP